MDTNLVVHAYRSPTQTRGMVFFFIFTAHHSGPYRIDRTPKDPLIQDSVSSAPEPIFDDNEFGTRIIFDIAGGFLLVNTLS